MFEAFELGRKLSKQEYKKRERRLRSAILEAQFALGKTDIPVIVIVSGVDGAGKAEFVHRLNEWLDPRGVSTHAFFDVSDEEREHPFYWRFWRAMPARGQIAIFFGSWYTEPITSRVYGTMDRGDFDTSLQRISTFEPMLVADQALIVKLWFHISKKALRHCLQDLETDPNAHWRQLPTNWKDQEQYDGFAAVAERAIRRTDSGDAPWIIIDAEDRHYREIMAGTALLDALEARLESVATTTQVAKSKAGNESFSEQPTLVDQIDLTRTLEQTAYRKYLSKYQRRVGRLSWKAFNKKISTVAVFEGWDASGKGSGIRRLTQAMDPRLFVTIPISAPSDEEQAHHYFWRFWRHLPRDGKFAIFDRSWYGRVLVERVEGFATPGEWRRAYLEVNEFEEQLVEHGVIICKFWIHISMDEQLKRFNERKEVPYKRYKITEEDWRNRKKWNAYKEAVNDMVARTNTDYAPWTLVPGNDKKFARIKILKTVCERLQEAL